MSEVSGPNYLGKVSASSTKFFSDSALAGGQSSWTQINTKPFPTLVPVRKHANVTINGDLTLHGVFNNLSDIRLKENIRDLSLEHADLLMDIHPRAFAFKNDLTKSTHFGFIAQEVEEVFPNLVKTAVGEDKRECKCVNYLEMIPLLLLKIQDLQSQIDELKSKKE
jgi:hypothetical protein